MKWGTFLSTLGFVLAILLQIFARLFLATAPSWTEEAARVFRELDRLGEVLP